MSSAGSLNLGRSQNGVLGNGFEYDKMSALSELKISADKKFHVTQNIKTAFHWTENICSKGENAGYQNVSKMLREVRG